MAKLDIKAIQKNGIRIFNTKKEALNYISKSSFKVDYVEYVCSLFRSGNKWLVKWEKRW